MKSKGGNKGDGVKNKFNNFWKNRYSTTITYLKILVHP
jgi:hypothetical protein